MVLRRFLWKKRQRDSCGEFRNLERDFHYCSFRTFGLTQKYQKVKHGEKPRAPPPALAERARKICAVAVHFCAPLRLWRLGKVRKRPLHSPAARCLRTPAPGARAVAATSSALFAVQ